MFDTQVYTERRKKLADSVETGVILMPGNVDSPMNYPANTYLFRQDSSFLYYFGLDVQGLVGVIDVDEGREMLFGNDFTIDDVIWMGPQPSIEEQAAQIGIEDTLPLKALPEFLNEAVNQSRPIHYLPQYRAENLIKYSSMLGIYATRFNDYASLSLLRGVIAQRSIKSEAEIEEIEKALEIARVMHLTAMAESRPGLTERLVMGAVKGASFGLGNGPSFPIILSINGQTLHNHRHDNVMNEGDLVVHDSGAESLLHYASDITRTYPVSGSFTDQQKGIYQIVLNALEQAIEAMKPGTLFRDVHLQSARIIASGLHDLGLMQGDIDEAVNTGAHALFFPHGLGHMMGLDVHDMEGLGEDLVGYDEDVERSTQFGLAYLRMGKALEAGHVLTVEPGLYFIPELIEQWKSEDRFAEFINYDALDDYMDFGGVRIEDDVLVTPEGSRVLGKPIPKTIEEVEAACRG